MDATPLVILAIAVVVARKEIAAKVREIWREANEEAW